MGVLIRLVCMFVGYKLIGFFGVLIGFFVGGFIVKGLRRPRRALDPALRQKIESTLFSTAFPLMGYLAKADGHISEQEVSATEQLMARMQLNPEQRKEAITLFKGGAKTDFNPEPLVNHFMLVCGAYADVKQILLVYLMTIAMADGNLNHSEKETLQAVAGQLGYSRFVFEQLLRMVNAQQHFRGGSYHSSQSSGQDPQASRADAIKEAYDALGVEASCSETELKRAYRKLMSQYHPDKLAGQGVPDEMIKVATERAQEVQAAYDTVKKARN